MSRSWLLSKSVSLLLALVLAACANTGRAQECGDAAIAQATSEVFSADASLNVRVYVSDLALLSTCRPASAHKAQRLIAASAYVLRECEVGPGDSGAASRECTNPVAPGAIRVPSNKTNFCDESGRCRVEFYSVANKDSDAAAFSMSGGLPFASFLGHAGVQGHFEITRNALSSLSSPRFSADAINFIADASRDADFYDWGNPAAHAQLKAYDDDSCFRKTGETLNLRCGSLDETSEQGRDRFFQWTRHHFQLAKQWCEEGNPANAAYVMGYAVHAVQDMVFHEGMSNAEHSYIDLNCGAPLASNATCVDSGFRFREKLDLATTVSKQFLSAFLDKLKNTRQCSAAMASLGPVSWLSQDRKGALRRTSGLDFGPTAFLKYRDLARQVAEIYNCEGPLACRTSSFQYELTPKWLGWIQRKPNGEIKEITQKAGAIVDALLGSLP